MGTLGPGSLHLLNGLYDARKSHAPVLAICGQVPLAELGTDFFQEVDNDTVFSDVAEFRATVTSPSQMPGLQSALAAPGASVLTLPGDIGGAKAPDGPARFVSERRPVVPDPASLDRAAQVIEECGPVTLLVGAGACHARAEVLALAERLCAPMVLPLKAKEQLERENPFAIGQSGLIGNPAAQRAFERCELLLMVGTDFPYTDWYPKGKRVIQVDIRQAHIGRRMHVELGVVGDGALVAAGLIGRVAAREDRSHLEDCTCGDGGLTMLLGELITAVHRELPVKLVVFNNGRLGMVKLEQEQAGLPQFGTVLGDVDLAAVARACGMHGMRVSDGEALGAGVRDLLAHDGPALLDVVTNSEEVALPPKVTPAETWGFAIAKLSETLESHSG